MKNFFLAILICTQSFVIAQTTCYDKAIEFRNAKFDFDSVFIRIKQAQDMVIGCQMPNDSITTLQGKKKKISDYKGKPLVINFWYLHCPPCINEMPSFNELLKKYVGKMNILAISQDPKKQVQEFLAKHVFKAEIVSDAQAFIDRYNLGSGYPFTLVIDQKGKITRIISGGRETPDAQMDLYKEISPLIDAMLTNKKN
jgi:peroxiredoxin